MAAQTALSSAIAISATAPATQDQAGYEAGTIVYTTIGEVTDIPAFGETYAEVTHSPLAEQIVQKFKGSNNPGTIDLSMARDDADAGQILLQTALDDVNGLYTFRVTLADTSKVYFQARVMSRTLDVGTIDTIVASTATLGISVKPVPVAA